MVWDESELEQVRRREGRRGGSVGFRNTQPGREFLIGLD